MMPLDLGLSAALLGICLLFALSAAVTWIARDLRQRAKERRDLIAKVRQRVRVIKLGKEGGDDAAG